MLTAPAGDASHHGLPSRLPGKRDDFVQLLVRICTVQVLVFKVGHLQALHAADMRAPHYQTSKAKQKAVITMHVIAGFNVVNDVAEVVRVYDVGSQSKRHTT